jgi:hypothetical protein
MSVISEKLRVALYSKLTAAGVTAAGSTGAHYHRVPEGSVLPYIVFSRVAPGLQKKTLAFGNAIIEDDLWQISVFADEDSSTTKEPTQLAWDILNAAMTSINTGITLTGATVKYIAKQSDIPSLSELSNGRWIYQEGFNLRTQTE